jgi:DNA-binding beta-propeller fold protein YncE
MSRNRAPSALRIALILALSACTGSSGAPRDTGPPASSGNAMLQGRLLVANQQSGTASIIDLSTGSVRHVVVGTGPHEAAISPDGRLGVVTVYGAQVPGNRLAVFDMRSGAVSRTIDLGEFARPHDVVFLPGSSTKVAVTSEASQRVIVVDLTSGTVEADVETRANGSHMLALAADGATLFTTNVPAGSISQLDLARRAFVRHIAVAPAVEGIAITPDGGAVWVGSNQAGTVSIIDVATGVIADTLRDMGTPYRITISPNGIRAAIPDPRGNRVIVADVRSRRVTGELAGIGSPRGVDIAPDDRTAFVTLGPEGKVVVVDLVAMTTLARYTVGSAPDGVAWGPSR